MRIAVTGASGFLGGRLLPALAQAGHEPVALVRARPDRDPAALDARLPGAEVRAYDPLEADSVARAIVGCRGVINLAGKDVLGARWSTAFLESVRVSRIDTTQALVEAMRALDEPPQVLVSASAIGIYGPRAPDETCTEATDDLGHDFLAVLCRDWEAAAQAAAALGTRVVPLRIGIVLGAGGGALARMGGPFRLGLGGRIGHGRQILSWIHVDDLVRLVLFLLETEDLRGPVNATAPEPVSSKAFAKALGRALHRPAFLPVPKLALRALFGRGASVLTTGQRVLPAVLRERGFAFEHETIDAALAAIYG